MEANQSKFQEVSPRGEIDGPGSRVEKKEG